MEPDLNFDQNPVPEIPVPITRILIIGMKHTGKSTHGRALAGELGLPFIDLDDLIMELYHRRGGEAVTVRQVYRELGKERFMALEAEAAAEGSAGPVVVAAGGGLADNRAAMSRFRGESAEGKFAAAADRSGGGHRSSFLLVHLSAPEEVLFSRIAEGGIPPFLEGDGGMDGARARFGELFKRREAVYRRIADVVIDLEDVPEADNSRRIIDKIRIRLNQADPGGH